MQVQAISKKSRGFSLVELLVAIFIIGMLMGVVLPNLIGARERGKDTQKKQDLESIKNGLRIYYNDNQSYPASGSLSSLVPTYIPSLVGVGYTYTQTSSGEGFQLCVVLEGKNVEINNLQTRCATSTNTVCGNSIAGGFIDNLYVICDK